MDPSQPWDSGGVCSKKTNSQGWGGAGGKDGIPGSRGGGLVVFTELKTRLSPARPRRTIACGRGDTGRPHTTLEDREPCHPPPAPGLIMIM